MKSSDLEITFGNGYWLDRRKAQRVNHELAEFFNYGITSDLS